MSKIRPYDLIYEHNCVTVPLFFTPRAKAAQARMQLASPANIIKQKNITRCGTENSHLDNFTANDIFFTEDSNKKTH